MNNLGTLIGIIFVLIILGVIWWAIMQILPLIPTEAVVRAVEIERLRALGNLDPRERQYEIDRLRVDLAEAEIKSAKQAAEIDRLRAELNQAPDELLAHENSQLRAEIERLMIRAELLATKKDDR